VIASFEVLDAVVDRSNETRPFVRLEMVVDGHELDLGPLRQLGGLVDHEAAIPDDGFERGHDCHSRSGRGGTHDVVNLAPQYVAQVHSFGGQFVQRPPMQYPPHDATVSSVSALT